MTTLQSGRRIPRAVPPHLAFGTLARVAPASLALGALALVVLLQVELVFSKSVNWDEFYHFSQIHQHLLRRPDSWMQAPYVWLFAWVPSLPGDGIAHIQIIRLLTLLFELVTIAAIVAGARRFADDDTALLCALTYITGGYVFLHGFALRADMIAAALLMTALVIALYRPLRWPALALIAVLGVLAFVSTIKAVLYAPAFFGVALFRLERPTSRWVVAGTAAAAVIGATLFLLAAPLLQDSGLAGIFRCMGELGRMSVERMFLSGLFPHGEYLIQQTLLGPILAITIILTFFCTFARRRRDRIPMLCLLAPLGTVAIYRNAYPYHFAFILPPAMIAAAPAVDFLRRRYGMLPFALLLLVNAVLLSATQDRQVLRNQRVVQTAIHRLFPEPVAYIDESGMAADFPRAVPHFASGWALENYRNAGVATYSLAMQAEPVPLLIANSWALQNVFTDTGQPDHLLPADVRLLRKNYIPHWGLVYVAGKTIAAGSAPSRIDVAVPGLYTVEGGPVVIAGRRYATGEIVLLERGPAVVGGGRREPVTLRWGEHLPIPAPWPGNPLFTDY